MMNDATFGQARFGGQQQQQQQNPLMRIAQLLRNKHVQDELKLDESRAQDAVSALRSVAGGLSGEFQALASLAPNERAERVTHLRAQLERTVDDALSNVLDVSKLRRFREIRLQAKGLQALADPQVSAALGLTDGQTEQIRNSVAQSRQEVQSLMQEARQLGNPEEARKRLTSSRKAAMDRTLAVLTPGQQKAWREMIGEQFEMPHDMQAGGPPMGMGGPGMGRPGMGGPGAGGFGGPRPGMRGPGMGGPRGGQRGDDDFDSLDEELF